MEIGIVGLPMSGKTTVFNAVTRGNAQVASHSGSKTKPNIGVAKVQDDRLDVLAGIYEPKRQVPAEVTYVDIPAAPEGLGETRGISGEFLNELQKTDALLVTTRAFEDPSVPHSGDDIDPFRDAETMLYELAFADLQILDRRLAHISAGFKGAKPQERENLNREQTLLRRLKDSLDAGTPVGEQSLSGDEARMLEGFQLLTAKPLVVAVNADESQISEAAAMEAKLTSAFNGPRIRTAVICGILEMELAQMEPEEEQEFRESLGVGDSGLDRMIRLSHEAADLVTFFTGNENEARAWMAPRDTTALQAAGKVHSDFERGFIRAEVVGFRDLDESGSIAEARRRGVLRQEGKTYLVQDGDVINILFNI